METESYGSTYENVSIIGGVIITGNPDNESSANPIPVSSDNISSGNPGVVSAGNRGLHSSLGVTDQGMQNGVGSMPKSSSTDAVVGLAKKPVPTPRRRTSLLTAAEMSQTHGPPDDFPSAATASAAASSTSVIAKSSKSIVCADSAESAIKLSPESPTGKKPKAAPRLTRQTTTTSMTTSLIADTPVVEEEEEVEDMDGNTKLYDTLTAAVRKKEVTSPQIARSISFNSPLAKQPLIGKFHLPHSLSADASNVYNIPPIRARPLKVAIPEKEDFDDIYDTPSSTPASAGHVDGLPFKSASPSVEGIVTSSASRLSLPAPVGRPCVDIQLTARTSLPPFPTSAGDVLMPTHDSCGVRLHEAVEEEEEEAPTYDMVPTPSPAGSRVQSSISLGGSRAQSSLSSSESAGDRASIASSNRNSGPPSLPPTRQERSSPSRADLEARRAASSGSDFEPKRLSFSGESKLPSPGGDQFYDTPVRRSSADPLSDSPPSDSGLVPSLSSPTASPLSSKTDLQGEEEQEDADLPPSRPPPPPPPVPDLDDPVYVSLSSPPSPSRAAPCPPERKPMTTPPPSTAFAFSSTATTSPGVTGAITVVAIAGSSVNGATCDESYDVPDTIKKKKKSESKPSTSITPSRAHSILAMTKTDFGESDFMTTLQQQKLERQRQQREQQEQKELQRTQEKQRSPPQQSAQSQPQQELQQQQQRQQPHATRSQSIPPQLQQQQEEIQPAPPPLQHSTSIAVVDEENYVINYDGVEEDIYGNLADATSGRPSTASTAPGPSSDISSAHSTTHPPPLDNETSLGLSRLSNFSATEDASFDVNSTLESTFEDPAKPVVTTTENSDIYENDDDGVDEPLYETVWAGPSMKMVSSSTPNPKQKNAESAASTGAASTSSSSSSPRTEAEEKRREEEEDDRVLRELVSKPAGHRGPLTKPSAIKNDDEKEKNDENDYVILSFPSRNDRRRNCESNLLPEPIGEGGRENYHALCGAIGVQGASAPCGEGDVGAGWLSRARTNSARLSSVSMTSPQDGIRGSLAENEGFGRTGADNEVFGDDVDWQKRCEEFNRGDFLRSSSTSAPSRFENASRIRAAETGVSVDIRPTTMVFPSRKEVHVTQSVIDTFDPLAQPKAEEEYSEEIYDDVPPELLSSSNNASEASEDVSNRDSESSNQTSAIGKKADGVKPKFPPNYTVLHFESKKDEEKPETTTINENPLSAPLCQSSESPTSSLPAPPVPPHAVDHSTYEPVASPERQRFRSQPSELSNVSIDSGPDDGCSSDGDLCEIEHPVLTTTRPKLLSVNSFSSVDGGRLLDGPLKEGWLYKLTKTPAGTNRWVKRWVCLTLSNPEEGKGGSLKYFASEKDPLSRRLIRGGCILDVRQSVGSESDARPYRVIVQALNREYVFAAETCKDMCEWSMGILRLNPKQQCQMQTHQPGGEMCFPDKKGYLRVESVDQAESTKSLVGRRFLAVKGPILCIYKEEKDFVDDAPVVQLEMKLACIKDLPSKHKFQLIHVAQTRITFGAESQDEMVAWQKALRDATAEGLSSNSDRILTAIRKNASNRFCADCGRGDPEWAVVNWGLVVCKDCSGVHRELGVSYSKVRSLKMDEDIWTDDVVTFMQNFGNENGNRIWEYNLPSKINSESSDQERKIFIEMKYKMREFCHLYPMKDDQETLDMALAKSVQNGEMTTTMRLIATGADVTSKWGEHSLLQLANRAEQPLQATILTLHGANVAENPSPYLCSRHRHQGSLRSSSDTPRPLSSLHPHVPHVLQTILKMQQGGVKGKWLRRKCVLEAGTLKCFDEKETTTTAKETLPLKEVVLIADSVASTSTTQSSPTDNSTSFELLVSNRSFFFDADAPENQMTWKSSLAFNCLPSSLFAFSCDGFSRAGKVILRDSCKTAENLKGWIALKGKHLGVWAAGEDDLLELDLRKNVYAIRAETDSSGSHLGQLWESSNVEIQLELAEGRSLHIHADNKKETEAWLTAIQTARNAGRSIEDQLLTKDNVPVIVEECIAFVLSHGLFSKGIYRHQGSESVANYLLARFRQDARAVKLRLRSEDVAKEGDAARDACDVHDVTGVLKKFLGQLPDALLMSSLHGSWMSLMGESTSPTPRRLKGAKDLVRQLPIVNAATLKALLTHFWMIDQVNEFNCMTISNLCGIFGETLMSSEAGFEEIPVKTRTLAFLIEHRHHVLPYTAEERTMEEEILDKLKKIHMPPEIEQTETTTFLFSVLVEAPNFKGERRVTLSPGMTALELTREALELADLQSSSSSFACFECIADGQLQRLVHFDEDVYDIATGWGKWVLPADYKSTLTVKPNFIHEDFATRSLLSSATCLLAEVLVSEKSKWKKMTVEFIQAQIVIYEGDKKNEKGRWRIEDVNIYLGTEEKRLKNLKDKTSIPFCFTFVSSLDPIKTSPKETPCIGRSIAFPGSDLFYKWLAGLLLTKHNGVVKAPVEAASTPSSRRPNSAIVRASNLQQHPHLPGAAHSVSASSSSRAPPPHHPAHIPGAQAMFSASIRRQLTSVIQHRPESTASDGSGGKS